MIPPNEKITREDALRRIEHITISVSDMYVETYEDEIRYSHEQEKLSLWITGAIIALELLLLSKLEKTDFSTNTSVIFACLISALTCFAATVALLTKLKKTRLISKYLDTITSYKYQKSNILLNLNSNTRLRERLIKDFAQGALVDKIFKFEYTERKPHVPTEKLYEDSQKLLALESKPNELAVEKMKIEKEYEVLAEEHEKALKADRNYLENSHRRPSTIIVFQVLLVVIYYIFLTYQ